MSILTLVLIAIAVSIDGFWGGFTFGLRKIAIPFPSLVIISSLSVICTMATMLLGSAMIRYIPLDTAKWIGASLLFIIGFISLKEGFKQRQELKNEQERREQAFSLKNLFRILGNPMLADIDRQNDIKPFEGVLLGLAVAMDASIAAFTLALAGYNPLTTPFLFGFTHFILIGLGNTLAMKQAVNYIGEKFALLPGFILMFLAVIRII